MAPRGRGRRRGRRTEINAKMNAALDAMREIGFTDDVTRKKLKELLLVYEEENWSLIEEDSYRVLVESILDQQKQIEEQKNDTGAGSSGGALAPPCSETEALEIVLATNEFVEDSASQTDRACDTNLLTDRSDGSDHLPSSGNGTGTNGQNINLEKDSGGKNTRTVIASPHPNDQEPQDGFPIRSRRPCHGWICSDDEIKELKFVELEPAPLPEELLKLLTSDRSNRRRKRKTRWDLRPEDM